jgi:flavin reductase (DIM6/NTAB) family NADH-FMN oxidoreductase RutF
MTIDPETYKIAMRQWAAGVTVVTTTTPDGKFHGVTASSFTSVSLDPVLVLICLGKEKYTHHLISESGKFVVNVLHTGQIEWGKRFAGMYPEIEDRFYDIEAQTAMTGAPILPGVLAWLDCTIHTMHDAGDHTIFIGAVVAADGPGGGDPLLYFQRQWGTFDARD